MFDCADFNKTMNHSLGLVGDCKSNGNRPLTLPSVPSSADLKNKVKTWRCIYIETGSHDTTVNCKQGNSTFLKKLPSDAEVTNVLVGGVDFLDKPISALVRLSNSIILGDFTEVPVPTRFVFVLLGPKVSFIFLFKKNRMLMIVPNF